MTGQRQSDEPPGPLEELESAGVDDLFLPRSKSGHRPDASAPVLGDEAEELSWGLPPGRAARPAGHPSRAEDWEGPELDG
ncbi:hypothetical protein GXW83_33335 [Streptacidiphilus sp. PB12-B1b]|uniref:hypothetical protein n=1 Tax=Streptacidiphilus sp. PB12-B1b TaxID=2705012 RepID=UPI0015FBB21D|nr:hypothetical protein [Streptacidiphilus sp. PB12-B1b]QMU79860.1 hypothetical protein GXW83_33335 [Streptacidiphilus sp. PB12-B1b]